jgi:hypothetical protein
LCTPAVEKLTGRVAAEPVTLTVPSGVAPSKNWMLPVVAPKAASDAMVAVRLVDWPTSDGLTELVSVSPVTLPTSWVRLAVPACVLEVLR